MELFIEGFIFNRILYHFRILSNIEKNIITGNINTSSGDNLIEEYNVIKTNIIDHGDNQESPFQSVNITTSVRNVTLNEDIPSFREWTKKQLEEAEKQPGIKLFYTNYNYAC